MRKSPALGLLQCLLIVLVAIVVFKGDRSFWRALLEGAIVVAVVLAALVAWRRLGPERD